MICLSVHLSVSVQPTMTPIRSRLMTTALQINTLFKRTVERYTCLSVHPPVPFYSCVSLCLTLDLSLCHPSISLPLPHLCVSFCATACLSAFLSHSQPHLPVSFSVSLPVSLSECLYACLTSYQLVPVSTCLTLCLSTCLSHAVS